MWRPGTTSLHTKHGIVAATTRARNTQRLSYPAPHTGWYIVELQNKRHGAGRYALQLAKSG